MANITASMVKDLRDKTGAGMMDCKAALAETDGEMETADGGDFDSGEERNDRSDRPERHERSDRGPAAGAGHTRGARGACGRFGGAHVRSRDSRRMAFPRSIL